MYRSSDFRKAAMQIQKSFRQIAPELPILYCAEPPVPDNHNYWANQEV